ncbi:MAG: ABC transporter permease [Actinomycetota bacterium]
MDDAPGGTRRGTWQPYALLSPGVLWLVLFFVVPLLALVKIAFSEQKNRFTLEFDLTFRLANFSDALDEFGDIFLRSFAYAAIATLLCVVIGYPLAYVVAFRADRWRNFLLGLVVVPFFTSYLIRTIAWTTIFGDNGPVIGTFEMFGVDGILGSFGILDNGRLMNTEWAVIGGLTYNFLPFMILPIYVSLEKIDVRLVEAAKDLYSSAGQAFRKVVLPLSLPGVFAGTLLTFIPASGDYVNAQYLGGPNNRMIGNIVQNQFLEQNQYPSAAAMALVLMAIITAGVLLYAKLLGTDELAAV